VKVPDTVTTRGQKLKVTAIADKAFYKNKKLTAVTIGKYVKKIGAKAFYGCGKLKTITLRTAKLTGKTVGANAFKGLYAKAVFKCPKAKLKAYRALLAKKGAPKKAKYR
ncbi:MAG: leucine-rich repeat protein, partial [Clostridia bacterium]|nr:leucine-rich repeat protein [Clostridia bacterium]